MLRVNHFVDGADRDGERLRQVDHANATSCIPRLDISGFLGGEANERAAVLIFRARNRLEVRWIHAVPHAARVVEFETLRYRADCTPVVKGVSRPSFPCAVRRVNAVAASIAAAGPKPTAGLAVHNVTDVRAGHDRNEAFRERTISPGIHDTLTLYLSFAPKRTTSGFAPAMSRANMTSSSTSLGRTSRYQHLRPPSSGPGLHR